MKTPNDIKRLISNVDTALATPIHDVLNKENSAADVLPAKNCYVGGHRNSFENARTLLLSTTRNAKPKVRCCYLLSLISMICYGLVGTYKNTWNYLFAIESPRYASGHRQ